MTPRLIELRDPGISVRGGGETLARSPGFASIAGKAPVFGEDARRIARLHPRQSFNQFWAQLSLDPLALKNEHFRHTADLAHAHLDILTRDLDLGQGAVLAAPGHYNRNQLAILLGIVRQCSFDAIGLVDLALLQAAGTDSEACVIIDLQLHQCVLTSFRRIDGQLVRDKVVQVPASGLLALQDAWSNLVTDAFIRQSRFDPQHNAETEQYIHNQLPEWLAQSQRENELLLEINHKGTVHQARLTREQLEQRTKNIFTRIARELDNLRDADMALHTLAGNLALPGFGLFLPGLVALDEDSTEAATLRFLEHIQRPADKLSLITRLPLEGGVADVAPVLQRPTHVLFRHKAIALPGGRLLFGSAPQGLDCARVLPLPELPAGSAFALLRGPRGVELELHGNPGVLHNGAAAETGRELKLGDRLRFGPDESELHLITAE